ncbi:AAA family ATPase [Streptomyces sp. NPDC059863]|uniref:AAA family ATPase n=1 Tax=unclassified Streptomyces TaxID=2593676 RepID=UPI00364FDD19
MTTPATPSSASQRIVPFITRVQIENYKSIAHCDVHLGPFTVLLGLNAAGKSNFLDAIRFVRDAVSRGPVKAVIERGGLGNVLRRTPEPTETCRIGLDFRIPAPVAGDAPWAGRYEITLAPASGSHPDQEVSVRRETCEIGLGPGVGDGSPVARFQVRDGIVDDPTADHAIHLRTDNLYLRMVGASDPYAGLYEALTDMYFYDPVLASLRDARSSSGTRILDEDGGNLGAVLGTLEPVVRDRLDAYIGAIVPGAVGVGPSQGSGGYVAAQMSVESLPGQPPQIFGAESMSEGTVRAVGLLTALFQPRARDGRIRLVAVEEPELALHPMAGGALFDALTEASAHVQVLATSQSSELFDRKETDLDAIKVVAVQRGVTVIGAVDAVSREIVAEGLSTVGDLLRSDQLEPETEAGEGTGR